MSNPEYVESALYELRFWLQVMGDHAWWLRITLVDPADQATAQNFVGTFDQLLRRARQPLDAAAALALSRETQLSAVQLRVFKLDLLRRADFGKVLIILKPTTINHMVNELDELLRVLCYLTAGSAVPPVNPLHYHDLWLTQVEGHADTVASELDPTEKDYINASRCYSLLGVDLLRKSQELTGHLRTGLCDFPALGRLNEQVAKIIAPMTAFLDDVARLRLTARLAGNLPALIPEHYAREQCYYLRKLSAVTGNPPPACDPTRQGYRPISCWRRRGSSRSSSPRRTFAHLWQTSR